MTEAEWDTCTDLWAMLNFVRPWATVRKALAFASSCECLLGLPHSQEADVAPADTGGDAPAGPIAQEWGYDDASLIESFFREAARVTLPGWPEGGEPPPIGWHAERVRTSCGLLRDLFKPFRRGALDPSWLTANGGAARRVAAAIYAGQDFDHLPILADALEEAGCQDAEILGHLRGPGLHVRGCWPVDLVLGRSWNGPTTSGREG